MMNQPSRLVLVFLLLITVSVNGAEPLVEQPVKGAAATGAPADKNETRKESDQIKDLLGDTIFARIYEIFQAGGPIMWVLLATSVIGMAFVLERGVALRNKVHIVPGMREEVQARVCRDGYDAGRLLLAGKEASLAKVLDSILIRKGATRREMEQVLEDEASRVLWDLRLNVRPVGIVASVSPLLGLLGTVFGLIGAFKKAAELGMDDPRNFSAGIYEALYTTAFGLTIAIPFLIAYHYLRGKADVIMREVEDQAIDFVISLNVETPAGQGDGEG